MITQKFPEIRLCSAELRRGEKKRNTMDNVFLKCIKRRRRRSMQWMFGWVNGVWCCRRNGFVHFIQQQWIIRCYTKMMISNKKKRAENGNLMMMQQHISCSDLIHIRILFCFSFIIIGVGFLIEFYWDRVMWTDPMSGSCWWLLKSLITLEALEADPSCAWEVRFGS